MEGGDPQPLNLDLVALVVQQYQKRTRGPYGVDEALQAAKQADADSIQRILLDESESVWRAYFASIRATESSHGFSGKAEITRLLNDLRAQSIECQRAFAKQLTIAMESEGIEGVRQSNKRRRTTVEDYTPTSVPPVITTTNNASISIDPGRCASEQLPLQRPAQKDVYVGAPLEPAEQLFHEQFWNSIERIPSKEQPGTFLAGISMVFQQGHTREHFGCQMEIEIAEEKVAELAFDYFGVKLETKDGVRSVRYPGGGKIEPDPAIKLRACRPDFSGIFRGEMLEAAYTSPIHQREKCELRNRTDGVSMTITNQAKEGAKLTVFLGEWKASNIKKKFYG